MVSRRIRKVNMNLEIQGDEVISILKNENSLLDVSLISFTCSQSDDGMHLEMVFCARNNAFYKKAKLKFSGIVEFGFYYSNKYVFYNIESIKLLRCEDGLYYLSLDPDEENSAASSSDQNFVKSKKIILTL